MYEENPDPPFAVQIELTQGCNLACTFCGLQAIEGKLYRYMSSDTLAIILDDLRDNNWNPRIEFAMHGEPTLNPNWITMIEMTRLALPKAGIMVTSNGAGIVKDPVTTLNRAFDAGLNVYALDEYQTVNLYKKIGAKLERDSHLVDFRIGNYPADKKLSPHQRWKPNTRILIKLEDLEITNEGTHSVITNHAGSGGPLNQSKAGVRCMKPFRELAIRWDGSIAGCCNDWPGVYKCGNVQETSLQLIWSGPEFKTLRRFLYHGRREMPPCYGCDYSGYRLGLLPDKKGKESLPEPTNADTARWKSCIAGPTFTPRKK